MVAVIEGGEVVVKKSERPVDLLINLEGQKMWLGNKSFQRYKRFLMFSDLRAELHLLNEYFDMRVSMIDLSKLPMTEF